MAVERLASALDQVRIAGPNTNLAFLSTIIAHPDFLSGGVDTGLVDRELPHPVGAPVDHHPLMASLRHKYGALYGI